MTERTITVAMLVVAVIHVLPLSGVLGVERLASLYGIRIDGPDLEILMRHRAVLFAILGALFAYAAFVPSVRSFAFGAAFASIASFLWLAFSVGGFGEALHRVVVADLVAAVALLVAFVAWRLGDGRLR